MDKKLLWRVYVWEFPVRFYHWTNAIAITVLVATGFVIANPPAIISAQEATDSYWFGIVRFLHFATAYIFIFNLLWRLYWSIFGNKYASWRVYLVEPFTGEFWRKLIHVLKNDVLLLNRKPYIDVGHNPLATLSYLLLFLFSFIQIFTGLGLMSETSSWFLPQIFSWVPDALGGEIYARFLHHLSTWFFIVFFIIHFYLVLFHEWFEGRGVLSSMTSGLKFFEGWIMDVLRERKAKEKEE